MDISSLINCILADDGYNALSEDTKSKFEQYLHKSSAVTRNEIGINTTDDIQEIDFDSFNNSTTLRETKFRELQKEVEIINNQFKNALTQKHQLMLNNESLFKSLHEAETRERLTKMDDGILQLKINTLNENLMKCTQRLSDLEAKYYKDIMELKPELDEKDADILKQKNELNLLHIKCNNQNDLINILKQELDDLNQNHKNEIDKIKKELHSSQSLMNHYRECYENELHETRKLTTDTLKTKDYVNTLTASFDDLELKYSKLLKEYEQYKFDTKNTTNALINKLEAAEDIVKQLLPAHSDNADFIINKGTTITDVYAIYKETYKQLQDTVEKLELSDYNFKLLKQQILDEAPDVDKLEKDLEESNNKVKTLCETVIKLESELGNMNCKLKTAEENYKQLLNENKRLQSTEDDLSKQICFLLRNKQCQARHENHNIGADMSPQSLISKNYVTFENIQALQNQNKKLLEALRSLSTTKDEQEVKLISDLRDKIKKLEGELEDQIKINIQYEEKLLKLQSADIKSNISNVLIDTQESQDLSDMQKKLENDLDDSKIINNLKDLENQLSTANLTIKQLNEKLNTNNNAHSLLEQHVLELNQQIDKLLKKIKASNFKNSEYVQRVEVLQNNITSLEQKNHELKLDLEKMKTEYNNIKKENDSYYVSNLNYSRELRQKTELQKDFEKYLVSQLDSLIISWDSTLTFIIDNDNDNGKFKDDYKQLTVTLRNVRDNLLSKLELFDDLSSHRETSISRSRTNSFSVCSDERTNFQSVINKLEHEVKNMRLKLNESGQLNNQLKSELNVTKELYKSLEENLKKISDYSSQLEKELENTKKKCMEKDQLLFKARQELSEFNSFENNSTMKLQNQLSDYEKSYCKLLEELESTKENNDKLSKDISNLNIVIKKLEDDLKTANNNKDRIEKGLSHKIAYYKNKLERLDALELFNRTKSAEIDDLKNQKSTMENNIEEIKEIHEKKLNELNNEINSLKDTLKRWEFENNLLSEQYKLITNELSNMNTNKNKEECLNSSSTESINNDVQFSKMTKLINILKDEKNSTILQLNEAVTECNRLKSELEYKTKVMNDMQTQMKEIQGLHSSGPTSDYNHSQILEKIEFCNQVVEKNKVLEEENELLLTQFKELQKLHEIKNNELVELKVDMSGMQSLIDQKTAEILSAQKTIARWKERSTGSHSDTEYKQILNTLEREKSKMTTALEQLKSMKSDKSSLEELLKKQENDHLEEVNSLKQEIVKLKTKISSNTKIMETFKNIIKACKQKITDVTSEMSKVKTLARRYKQLSEELNKTLSTERISWQAKFDAPQQSGSRISIDLDEREKLIDQGKREQKKENESIINELTAKIAEAESNLNVAKSEIETTKNISQEKEMRAKQLLQQVRSKILNLTSELDAIKKHRDGLMARLDEAERGGKIQGYLSQITKLELENSKLMLEKDQVTAEKDRLSHDIQTLNHRVNALMRQFSNQQVKPSTSTGSEKQVVEPPTANIKPLGPAVNKTQPAHHSVTVNPWRSAAAETPLASIKPMTMQSRSVVVLPTSQTSSTSSQSSSGTSSSTTIAVHPQQPQSIDISSSGNALDSSEANSAAQSRHLTSSTLIQLAEGSESAATVSDSNETITPPTITPIQQVIGNAASPSVTTAQACPAISIALVVPQGREQVQTTVSQQTTVSVSTVSPSQSQIDSVQNENSQSMESSSSSGNNIASSSAPGPSTESEPSVITAGTSGPSCSSLDTTTHSNNSQRKRKADLLVTSYMKRSKSFMPREENRRETEYEAPTSSQRDSEVSNSYTSGENNPQDNKEVDAETDMEVTSEATLENNEVDLASHECTADTNNMNETSDAQNGTEQMTTGENTPEHSSSNAEATAMATIEEEVEEIQEVISFQENQPAPVSSASCEERKSTDNVTSDAESRLDDSDFTPTELQSGTSSDTNDAIGVSQSSEIAETDILAGTDVLDSEQDPIEVLSSEEEEAIEIKSTQDLEVVTAETRNEPDIISISSSPSKENETVHEESPVAGPSRMTDSTLNERKPITWDESP